MNLPATDEGFIAVNYGIDFAVLKTIVLVRLLLVSVFGCHKPGERVQKWPSRCITVSVERVARRSFVFLIYRRLKNADLLSSSYHPSVFFLLIVSTNCVLPSILSVPDGPHGPGGPIIPCVIIY